MKHHVLKQQIVQAVSDAYEHAYKADEKAQAAKPDFLKHVDAKLDTLLRPLFT